MTLRRVEYTVEFTNGVCECVGVEAGRWGFIARFSADPVLSSALFAGTAEQCASMWAVRRMARHKGTGVFRIRRVEVKRAWSVMEARDMSAWRALVLAAVDAGVVFQGEWDDGGGFSPWYVANPGPSEKELYAACCAAMLPKDGPIEDAELVEMDERANASLNDDDPAVRAIARDSIRLGYEVLRLRNEVFLAQRKLVLAQEAGHGDADASGRSS